MAANLLFGLLKESISAGRTLDFFSVDKDQIKKKVLSLKPLIANEFQVVGSIVSSKLA